jgi:succinoglycan biosynthesis transport protein ExoP
MRNLSPYFIQLNNEPSRHDFRAIPFRNAPKIEDGIGLHEVWRVIRRRLRLTIALTIAAVLITTVAVFLKTPLFTGRATLLITPEPPQLLDMTQLIADTGGDPEYDFYKTQFELLKGRALAARVIRDLNLEDYPAFNPHDSDVGPISSLWNQMKGAIAGLSGPETSVKVEEPLEYSVNPVTIDKYLSHLKVEPKPGTRLVTISFTLADRMLSARIANRHVDDFIRRELEIHSDAQRAAREFLEGELQEIGRRVQTAEAALNAYRQQNGVLSFDVDDTNKVAAQRMGDLSKAFTDAETRRIAAESQMELVQHGEYDSLPQVVNNPSISALRPQLINLEAEYAKLSTAFNPEYPKLAELKAQVEEARSAMSNQIGNIAVAVSRDYKASLGQEQKLRIEIQAEKQRDLALNDALLKDAVLTREVETNRDLYKNVLQRMQQMGVAERTPISNISIVEKAAPPLGPSSPKKLIDISISGLLALLLGLGLSFVLEQLDNRLKSAEEVESFLHLPSLAIAPDFTKVESSKPMLRRLSGDWNATNGRTYAAKGKQARTSVFEGYRTGKGEVYRAIRTGLLYSRAGAPPKTILISSSIEGEGKTWTAVNTALAFAQTGASTLLIDADLRRPRCHEMMESENGTGLSEILVGQCEPAGLIRRVNGHPLFFLAAGSKVPNPAELLTSVKMREVTQSFAEQYDYVLIDSAPMMYASDTIGIATMVDGVVVVLGAHTSKHNARRACNRLLQVGAKVLGVVLNGVDIHHPDYREQRRYYFSYDNYNRESESFVEEDQKPTIEAQ